MCGTWLRLGAEGIPQINDLDLQSKRNKENNAQYDRCMSQASLDYERTNPPSVSTRLLIVIAMDLVLMGFGWLIVWGCAALGRWVYRGFAAP